MQSVPITTDVVNSNLDQGKEWLFDTKIMKYGKKKITPEVVYG
jgi:hypothetical protein